MSTNDDFWNAFNNALQTSKRSTLCNQRELRRLDSLARLICQMDRSVMCVALAFDSANTLHVACNDNLEGLKSKLETLVRIFAEIKKEGGQVSVAQAASEIKATLEKGAPSRFGASYGNKRKNDAARAARKILTGIKRALLIQAKRDVDLMGKFAFDHNIVEALCDFSKVECHRTSGTHAELTLIEWEGADNLKLIGIDKMCCALCIRALNAFSSIQNNVQLGQLLSYRGGHGAIYNTNWQLPAKFLDNDLFLESFFGAKAWLIFQKLEDQVKENIKRLFSSGILNKRIREKKAFITLEATASSSDTSDEEVNILRNVGQKEEKRKWGGPPSGGSSETKTSRPPDMAESEQVQPQKRQKTEDSTEVSTLLSSSQGSPNIEKKSDNVDPEEMILD